VYSFSHFQWNRDPQIPKIGLANDLIVLQFIKSSRVQEHFLWDFLVQNLHAEVAESLDEPSKSRGPYDASTKRAP